VTLFTETDFNIFTFYAAGDSWYRERPQYSYVLFSKWHLVQRQTSV